MIEPDWNSQTWMYLKGEITRMIAELRSQNDSLVLDVVTTASIRGRIAALKQVAAMPESMRLEKSRRENVLQNAGQE